MAGKKNSKALFEAISRHQGSLRVPDWMRPGQPLPDDGEGEAPGEAEIQPPGPAEEQPPTELEAEDVQAVAPEVEADLDETGLDESLVEADEEEIAPAEETAPDAEPVSNEAPPRPDKLRALRHSVVWLAGERVSFSLNFVTAMVAIGGILVLLVAVFVLGRITADGRATAPTDTAEANGPIERIDLRPVITNDAAMQAGSGRRDPKRYYIIIERLGGNTQADYSEALRIVEFCRARHLPADVVSIGQAADMKFAVWCLLGFLSGRSEAAIKHAENVEKVGGEYFERHKTYRFQQRKKPGGKLTPSFYPGRLENAEG